MIGGSHKPTGFSYIQLSENGTQVGGGNLIQGGLVVVGIAAAALKIGDSVFLNGTLDTWAKSAVPANYATQNGIVVGGTQTNNEINQDSTAIGVITAANAGESVIVMTYGIAKAVADLALATNHVKVTGASVTSGRVSTTAAAAGNYLGVILDTAAGAASVVRVFVGGAH